MSLTAACLPPDPRRGPTSPLSPGKAQAAWKLTVAVCLLASLAAQAGPTGGDAPAADPAAEALVFEDNRTTVTAEADGRSVREVVAEVRINSEAGVKALAVLNFTYASANEVVEVEYVRVRKPDGTVVETPPDNIQDMPADITRSAPLYSDIHEKHVAVKGLGVGDVLTYAIRYRTVTPEVPGHFWYDYTFANRIVVKSEVLEISVPKAMALKVSSPTAKPVVREQDGRRIYRWSKANPVAQPPEPLTNPATLVPDPSVQVSTFASWQDLGRWIGPLFAEVDAVTPEIQAKADELTKGMASDEDRIRAIYNFVALRYHYIGLDFGIGRYQPHAATEVLGNRYGDCKDKHTLLAALLKAAGYTAWPALVNTLRKVNPDMPSPAQFNHVITVVSNHGQLTWLDTTPEIAPYGLLLSVIRDKAALVLPTDAPATLMQTPAISPVPQEVRFTMDGALSEAGVFSGHADWTYRGDVELMVRMAFRMAPASRWQELGQRLSNSGGFAGVVSNLRVGDPEDIDTPFTLSYDYERKDFGNWKDKQITPPLPRLSVLRTDKDEVPKKPVYLGPPVRFVTKSRMELPGSYTLLLPDDVDAKESFGEYHASYRLDDGVLEASRELTTTTVEVPVSQWDKLLAIRDQMDDDQDQFLDLEDSREASAPGPSPLESIQVAEYLRQASEAVSHRDFQRAQELLEKVIALAPETPGTHGMMAAILLSQQHYDEGLAELRIEQKISPREVSNFGMAANILTYLDRREEAIDAWRKVLELDPKSYDAALNLSALLVKTDQRPAAIAVLEESVRLSPESPSLQLNLGEMYVASKDIERGLPHLRQAAEHAGTGQRAALVLNEAAYQMADNNQDIPQARQYAERAVGEIEGVAASASAPDASVLRLLAASWDTLGWVAFRAGDLPLAENYIHASWVLFPRADVGLHLGQVYEKQGRAAEAAHLYQLALTIHAIPEVAKELEGRYARVSGKAGAPAAGGAPTPSEELRRTRLRKLQGPAAISASADFYVLVTPDRTESVRYIRGDERLKGLGDQLATAKPLVEFPRGSKARVLRQVTISCEPASGCESSPEPL